MPDESRSICRLNQVGHQPQKNDENKLRLQLFTHKGGKITPRDGTVAVNQAKTGPVTMEKSMYSVLLENEDDDDEVVDKDELSFHPPYGW